jgi:hypothetical protein
MLAHDSLTLTHDRSPDGRIVTIPSKVSGLGANKKNFFNNRGNLNFRCLGERQVSYLPIDQKFIGVVSTETEI